MYNTNSVLHAHIECNAHDDRKCTVISKAIEIRTFYKSTSRTPKYHKLFIYLSIALEVCVKCWVCVHIVRVKLATLFVSIIILLWPPFDMETVNSNEAVWIIWKLVLKAMMWNLELFTCNWSLIIDYWFRIVQIPSGPTWKNSPW